jgi:DNA-binding response OmpR family regulator
VATSYDPITAIENPAAGAYAREVSRILVVDDDDTVSDVVARYLERDGHEVTIVADGLAGLASATEAPPDLVILDLMLPGMSGLDVCRRLREIGPLPVIMLTARSDEGDRVAGLELGADDYVTKPFSPRELVLRVNAVLRRAQSSLPVEAPTVLTDGGLVIDTAAHQATLDGGALALTAREYELLVFLLRQPRIAFTREDLFERVWGWNVGDVSTVTVHVRRLREKIEADPGQPRRLVTVWGVGYRYEPVAVPA